MKQYFCITPKNPALGNSIYVKAKAGSTVICYNLVEEFCKNRNIKLDEVNIEPIYFIKVP